MNFPLFDRKLVGNAEEALDLIGNVLESSTEYAIIGKDLEGKILLWNEGARRLYGYEPEEVVGKSNAAILHTPEDVREYRPRAIRDAALRDGKWEGTIQRVRKDGQQFTARVVITPRRDALGNSIGFLLISKDISEEIRLVEQLRLMEQLKATQFYTRSLIESNVDAQISTDPLGIITDVNQQMESLTGHCRAELIGSPFKAYFTDPAHAEEGIRLVLREGKVTDYELTAWNKAGKQTVVSYNASTFRNAAGELQGVFVAAHDITERKRFEQTLQEKNIELENAILAKDRFLASISHELRTPLNAVIGFTGTLLMKLPGPLNADQEKQLKIIQMSSKHLLALINDLLDLAKIESGKVKIDPECVVCQKVVEDVLTALSPLAESKGLEFRSELPTIAFTLWTDYRALTQILLNLTNNALKFTETGRVVLALERIQDDGHPRIEFRVTDTGVGIRPEDQARLFRAFERLGPSATARQEGTGLGLYVSQKLAHLLGGEIKFTSTDGQGSTFTLLLKE